MMGRTESHLSRAIKTAGTRTTIPAAFPSSAKTRDHFMMVSLHQASHGLFMKIPFDGNPSRLRLRRQRRNRDADFDPATIPTSGRLKVKRNYRLVQCRKCRTALHSGHRKRNEIYLETPLLRRVERRSQTVEPLRVEPIFEPLGRRISAAVIASVSSLKFLDVTPSTGNPLGCQRGWASITVRPFALSRRCESAENTAATIAATAPRIAAAAVTNGIISRSSVKFIFLSLLIPSCSSSGRTSGTYSSQFS